MPLRSDYPHWRLPDAVGNPADQMVEMNRRRPYDDAPAAHHVAWHERMAALWDDLALRDGLHATNGPWLADWHRRKAKEVMQRRDRSGGQVEES